MKRSRRVPADLDGDIRRLERLAYGHYGLSATEKILSVDAASSRTDVRLTVFGDPADRPPVLLLHGIASVNVIAAPLLTYLRDRRVIAVDWPGHGLSGENILPVGAGLRREAVSVIRSVLDALQIAEVDIVGHSMGAQFGLYAALDLGARVRRLVLLGAPGAGFAGVRPIPIMRVLAVPRLGALILSLPMSDKAFRRNNEKSLGPGALDGLPDDLLSAAKLIGERPGFAPSVASYFRALIRRGSVRPGVAVAADELSALAQPALLVWGDDDVFMTTDAASRSIASIRDGHLIRVANAGHAPWLQNPERVGAAVAAHLDDEHAY